MAPHWLLSQNQDESDGNMTRLAATQELQGRPPSAKLSPQGHSSGRPSKPSTATPPLRRFWARNKAAALVALAQLFGASMNLMARLLELEGEGMHPVQVLFLRQCLACICCMSYMWWKGIPDFPFGPTEVRRLLLARGVAGFFAVFGMWYSMMYLSLADATVITFLAPAGAGFICYFWFREPFTRAEQLATAVALLGVVLIAFKPLSSPSTDHEASAGEHGLPDAYHETTARERLLGVSVALLGVLGTAGAFTTLRMIGSRVHPLVSVNFFAMTCIAICALALGLAPGFALGQPALRWVTPASARHWALLTALAGLGLAMQYLQTAGLGADTSNRANAMVYTQMLFAVAFDRWVFGQRMGGMGFLGCALILGTAVGVVLTKEPPSPQPKEDDVEGQGSQAGEAEECAMLVGVADKVKLESMR